MYSIPFVLLDSLNYNLVKHLIADQKWSFRYYLLQFTLISRKNVLKISPCFEFSAVIFSITSIDQ